MPPVIRPWTPSYPFTGIECGDLPVPEIDEEIYPAAWVNDDMHGAQPYHLVLFGEKSSLKPMLEDIAERFQADLYLPTGEISDTMLWQMAKSTGDDDRPMIVFTISDCDPAGWQMPVQSRENCKRSRSGTTMHSTTVSNCRKS